MNTITFNMRKMFGKEATKGMERGTARCPQCEGAGMESALAKRCRKCAGSGVVKTETDDGDLLVANMACGMQKAAESSVGMVKQAQEEEDPTFGFGDSEEDGENVFDVKKVNPDQLRMDISYMLSSSFGPTITEVFNLVSGFEGMTDQDKLSYADNEVKHVYLNKRLLTMNDDQLREVYQKLMGK